MSATVTAPLQAILFRDPDNDDARSYEDSILRGLQGGRDVGGYLATGHDLGVPIRVFSAAPGVGVPSALGSFCHTLIVVLLSDSLVRKGGQPLLDWLEECWSAANTDGATHRLLVVALDEKAGRDLVAAKPALETLQLLQAHSLGEPAIRAGLLALRCIHECRTLVLQGIPNASGFLKVFISHAKLDGLPLAHALRHQIQALGWLGKFYDADDIPAGSNWQKELEKGVGSSLLVVLRSDVYEERFWCRQEVLWSDEYATPSVLVDLRTELAFPAGTLPLDRMPSVRIPDGNLLRILFHALREGLRFLLFTRRVEAMKGGGQLPAHRELRVFAFQPSVAALLQVCSSIAASTSTSADPSIILYPDPPLRAGVYEAAQALVASVAPGTALVTPNTLAALKAP